MPQSHYLACYSRYEENDRRDNKEAFSFLSSQVPEAAKSAVPEHVRKAAREVGLQAWRKRLKEIEMSEHDGEMYERYLAKVQRQVTALRLMLDTLQAKGKERKWMRHQSEGDLDESKLIEGLIGEKSVYKVKNHRIKKNSQNFASFIRFRGRTKSYS